MASPTNAFLGALFVTSFWTLLGYAVGRHLLPRGLAISAAPVIGWAVHSAATLPIFTLIGLSWTAVIGGGAFGVLISFFLLHARADDGEAGNAVPIPIWIFAAAAALALIPAVALLPKYSGDAVQLADPTFE